MIAESKYDERDHFIIETKCLEKGVLGVIKNHKTRHREKIYVNDLEGWYTNPIVVDPLKGWKIKDDEEGNEIYSYLACGDFKVEYEKIDYVHPEKENSADSVEFYATIQSYSDGTLSLDYLELPKDVAYKVFELIEPHCTGSIRGTPEEIAEEMKKL